MPQLIDESITRRSGILAECSPTRIADPADGSVESQAFSPQGDTELHRQRHRCQANCHGKARNQRELSALGSDHGLHYTRVISSQQSASGRTVHWTLSQSVTRRMPIERPRIESAPSPGAEQPSGQGVSVKRLDIIPTVGPVLRRPKRVPVKGTHVGPDSP